jgi:hypothetical protein
MYEKWEWANLLLLQIDKSGKQYTTFTQLLFESLINVSAKWLNLSIEEKNI